MMNVTEKTTTILLTDILFKTEQQLPVAAAGGIFLAGIIVLATYSFYYWKKKNEDYKKKKYPPMAPMGIFETVKMISSSDLPWKYLQLARDMNTSIFQLNLPMGRKHPMVAVIGNYESVREILTDPLTSKPYAIYGKLANEMSPTKTPSMFGLNGKSWHKRRKGTAPAFSTKHVRRMNTVAISTTEEWINNTLLSYIKNDESFDVGMEVLKIVLKAFCKTALEYDISNKEMDSFMYESDLANEEFLFKSISNPFRKYVWFVLPKRRRAIQATENIHKLCQHIIDSYRRRQQQQKEDNDNKQPTTTEEGTVINRIMTNPAITNDDERISEIWMYLVAGHDTTANSISWVMLDLAKHPSEQMKLREALLSCCCTSNEDWSKCDYIKMVVKESMRLHPVGANSPLGRVIGRDMVVGGGKDKYFLPKNTITFLPYILLGRNPKIYGDDVDQFNPSRWFPENNPTQEMFNAFIPFGLGKQNCIGQALANAELHCILARLITEFHFDLIDEGYDEFHLVWKPIDAKLKARKV